MANNKLGFHPKSFIKHQHCECYVDRNYQAKKHRGISKSQNANMWVLLDSVTHTPPALICRTHNAWIKWLSPADADLIESIS